MRELPRGRKAEKAVISLRSTINSEVRSPELVRDLVAHYRRHELTLERNICTSVEAHESYLTLHILPKWQHYKLSEVKTVAVEHCWTLWTSRLPPKPKTATSCLGSTVTVSGTSGFLSTRSARFAAWQKDSANLTCSHLRSFRRYCGNFLCVRELLSCSLAVPGLVDPSCSH